MIFQAIENFERDKREQVNANSFTTAVFAAGIFNGFAGKDTEKCEFMDLLPFSSDVKDAKDNRRLNEPTRETAKVFLELMEQHLLPPRVVAQAFRAKIIDRLEALV